MKVNFNLSQRIYEELKSDITNNVFKPGDRIPEDLLAKKYKVSRTPVREAIRKLEESNLIENIPNLGSFVRHITLQEIMDIYDFRGVVEGLAARRVAERISPDRLPLLEELKDNTDNAHKNKDLEKANQSDLEFHNFIILESGHQYIIKTAPIVHVYLSCFLNISNKSRMDLIASIPFEKMAYNHERIFDAIKCRQPEEAEILMRKHIEEGKNYLIDFALKKYSY